MRECVAGQSIYTHTHTIYAHTLRIPRPASRESVRNIAHKYNTLQCVAAAPKRISKHVEQVNTINVRPSVLSARRKRISDVGGRRRPGQMLCTSTHIHTSASRRQANEPVCVRLKIYGSIHYTMCNPSAYTINKIARVCVRSQHWGIFNFFVKSIR